MSDNIHPKDQPKALSAEDKPVTEGATATTDDMSTTKDDVTMKDDPTEDGQVTDTDDKVVVEDEADAKGKPVNDEQTIVNSEASAQNETVDEAITGAGDDAVVNDPAIVKYKLAIEVRSTSQPQTTGGNGQTTSANLPQLLQHMNFAGTGNVGPMNLFQTTLVHHDFALFQPAPTNANANYLMTDVRVGSPHPLPTPIQQGFIGVDLFGELMDYEHEIDVLISSEMGGAQFQVDFAMCSTGDDVIFYKRHQPTVLIHAEHGSNLVAGERWDANTTAYKGSRWLYITDKVRRFLIDIGLGEVAVEVRDFGFQHDEITPFIQPGPVLEPRRIESFNLAENDVMYTILRSIANGERYDFNMFVGPHVDSMKITWMSWPHRPTYGDFIGLVVEFDLNFEEEYFWPPFAQSVRDMFEFFGGVWADIPVFFRWAGEMRLGW
ncbi:hypothetical protein ABKA04_007030 [Annulohypoxylon sp. FPYF3050]